MCYDNSDMPVFAATATWIWIKGKQPVLTRNMLIREKNSTTPPHSVWSGALIKQKENIFTFQICCFSKAPLSVAYALYEAGRQRTAQGEMTQVTNGVVRNFLSMETHNYLEYDLWYIYMSYATARYNVSLSFSWNVLHMRHIFASWLNN